MKNNTKDDLRLTLKKMRNSFLLQDRKKYQKNILFFVKKILGQYSSSLKIALYSALHSEVDVLSVVEEFKNHIFLLPFIVGEKDALQFSAYDSQKLTVGRFGVREPVSKIAVEPDIVFVPLLGFTLKGYRLGYGGGFYDRTFAKYPDILRIGVAFSCQVLEEALFPKESWDVPMHKIITEKKIFDIHKTRRIFL